MLHSVWGCVVPTVCPKPMAVERSFHVTSASLQHGEVVWRSVALYLCRSDGGELEVATFSGYPGEDNRQHVDLDLTFRTGEHVSFCKKLMGDDDRQVPVLQLMGYYLDDCAECTGGKKTTTLSTVGNTILVLPTGGPDEKTAADKTAIFVDGSLEIQIKKKHLDDIEKIVIEKKHLEQELRDKNGKIEKLYSEVEELTAKLNRLQEGHATSYTAGF